MGDIAEAMINGDISWDGQWLGDGQGFPRNSDGSPQFNGQGEKQQKNCPLCQRTFDTKKSRKTHMIAKHQAEFDNRGNLVPITIKEHL